MSNKFYIKLAALALTALQMLTAVACVNNGDTDNVPEDTTPVTQGTTPAPQDTTAAAEVKTIDLSKYIVVRPESCESALLSAATAFRVELSDLCGTQIRIADDWVKKGDSPDNDNYEILLGGTNRSQSVSAAESLDAGDFIIEAVDNKIVICGGSDKATVAAMEYFRAHCLVDGKAVIEGKIEQRKQYSVVDATIGGVPVEQFTIVYPYRATNNEGKNVAQSLQNMLLEYTGKKLEIVNDKQAAAAHEIIIGETTREYSGELYKKAYGAYDYHIEFKDGRMYFAGESFGLQYCIKYLVDVYFGFGSSVPENLSASGSMYGHQIYNIENGGDVRIMSNNVWDCNSNKPAWEALGEDCSAKNRAIGLAATYMAYAPDVICLQEMSILMIGYIRKHLKDNGFAYDLLTYTVGSDADNTCILYRTDTLNLLDKGHHEYTYGNNGGSKSYTWGYFEQKATGKKFAALSTHMWYKSESAEPGSNKHRENQAAEIVAEMDKVIEKYGCPVFVMGDFNTRTNSEAFRVFLNGGFKNTYQLASVYADNHQGRHSCNADGFALEGSPGTYTGDAIDHILLKNGGDTKIYTFDHARPYFYIKLSDHYPVFVDATLG